VRLWIDFLKHTYGDAQYWLKDSPRDAEAKARAA
jgi:hypothetical protein